jgi:septal ring factor EnvC (AmiA/AmiB activator)
MSEISFNTVFSFAFVAVVLAVSIGIVLGRYVWPARLEIDPASLAQAREEAAKTSAECELLRSRLSEVSGELAQVTRSAGTLTEENARMLERVDQMAEQLRQGSEAIDALRSEREAAAAKIQDSSNVADDFRSGNGSSFKPRTIWKPESRT